MCDYLVPYVGYDGPRRVHPAHRKPKARLANAPMHHPRRELAAPVAPPVRRPMISVPNMSAEMRAIAEDVCIKHRVFFSLFLSDSREQRVVHAKREYIYRCRTELDKSFPQIGRSLNQDHTTILHSFKAAVKDPAKMAPLPRKEKPPAKPRAPHGSLSDRQQRVIDLAAKGLSNAEIAEITGQTPRQVKEDKYEGNRKLKRRAAAQATDA